MTDMIPLLLLALEDLHEIRQAETDRLAREAVKQRCANSVKHAKCDQAPMRGHIFCKHHFLAHGGYDRYSCARL